MLFVQLGKMFMMGIFLQIFSSIVILCTCYKTPLINAASVIDDVGLDITQYVTKYGYPIETHELQTEDGYILTFHRIPNGKSDFNSTDKKPAVLLMHGLFSSDMEWVNMGPEKGLGFLLADSGYDVWLGIQRGSTLNRRHAYLDLERNASQFWDFTLQELAIYDTASYIDYVLNKTGVENIYYIGYSQGTILFNILMSTKPEYNQYIKLAIGLGPVAFFENSPHHLVLAIAANLPFIELVADVAGIHTVLPHWPIITELFQVICVDGSPVQDLCAEILYIFGGADREQMNKTILPVLYSDYPAGASLKQVMHILQGFDSGELRKYDYGLMENVVKYGTPTPPSYNLTRITAPVVLFSGKKDIICDPRDVDRLESVLPNVVAKVTIPYENFSHLDFLWAKDVKELVYNDIIKFLKNADISENDVNDEINLMN